MEKRNLLLDECCFTSSISQSRSISSLIENSEKINIKSILSKIFVCPPYFAFKDIYKYKNFLIAPIKVEQKIVGEVTPISSAEASRHMAILGSCSLALESSEASYYLATKADIKISDHYKPSINKERLYVVSIPRQSDKRSASSDTFLFTESGIEIFSFRVGYTKFSQNLFNRVFHNHLRETHPVHINPYKLPLSVENIAIYDKTLTGVLPLVDTSMCTGHFNDAPILPVAILSHTLIDGIHKLWNSFEDNIRYHLLKANMELYEPTDINKNEKVIIKFLGSEGNLYNFFWEVRCGTSNKLLNRMEISFVKICD